MWTPDAFGSLEIRLADAWNVVEGVYLMIFFAVRRLVHFWDSGDELLLRCRLDFGWPVLGDTGVEVDIPLTTDIIADENEREQGELEERGAKGVVHIRIPDIGYQIWRLINKRHAYLSPFWRFPTPIGMIISERPHATKDTPVYRKPFENFVLAFANAWKPTQVLI